MSNQSALFFIPNDREFQAEKDERFYSADYLFPALWLASFSSDDIKKLPDPEDEENPFICLETSVDSAIKRLNSKSEALNSFCSNIEPHFSDWLSILQNQIDKKVFVDITEIVYMDEDLEETLDELKHSLTFFDSPSEKSAMAFMKMTCFSDIYNPETMEVNKAEAQSVEELLGDEFKEFLDEEYLSKSVESRDVSEYMYGYSEISEKKTDTANEKKKPWWKFW